MSILGWTDFHAAPVPTCRMLPIGNLALVLAAAETRDPRERLGLQIDLSDRWEAFLPAAPRSTSDPASAIAFTRERTLDIARHLDFLRARAQISVDFGPVPPGASGASGAIWLRDRARRLTEGRDRLCHLQRTVRHTLCGLPVSSVKARGSAARAILDILIDRQSVVPASRALRRGLPQFLPSGTLTVVGPLPAYGFTIEEETS